MDTRIPDKKITDMLLQGYTKTEIAIAVGLSKQRITQRVQELEKAWAEYSKEYCKKCQATSGISFR